ncbi:MAG: hypothetical protein IKX39_04530, partial [Muribaculaceae bacterium]|nr:hypothetical protein [Muribaculaceae bacterium]
TVPDTGGGATVCEGHGHAVERISTAKIGASTLRGGCDAKFCQTFCGVEGEGHCACPCSYAEQRHH